MQDGADMQQMFANVCAMDDGCVGNIKTKNKRMMPLLGG
jgi:hypothetical protein